MVDAVLEGLFAEQGRRGDRNGFAVPLYGFDTRRVCFQIRAQRLCRRLFGLGEELIYGCGGRQASRIERELQFIRSRIFQADDSRGYGSEFLKDSLIERVVGNNLVGSIGGCDDGQRTSVADRPSGTEEASRLLDGTSVDAIAGNALLRRCRDAVCAGKGDNGIEEDDDILSVFDTAACDIGQIARHLQMLFRKIFEFGRQEFVRCVFRA